MDPEEPECHEVTVLEGALGLFLVIGTVISYLPQHIKLIARKSSIGLSFWTAVLGTITGFASTLNYISAEFGVFQCCSKVSTLQCAASLLPVIQLLLIWICCLFIKILFMVYYHNKHIKADWSQTKLLSGSTVIVLIIMVSVYLGLALGISPTSSQVKTFGQFCVGVASIGVIIHWVPQIYKTYTFKRVGSLSILMIGLQGIGAGITAFFFSLSTPWYVWLSFVIAAILLICLFALSVLYSCREKREADLADYVVVSEDNEETLLTSDQKIIQNL